MTPPPARPPTIYPAILAANPFNSSTVHSHQFLISKCYKVRSYIIHFLKFSHVIFFFYYLIDYFLNLLYTQIPTAPTVTGDGIRKLGVTDPPSVDIKSLSDK